MKIWIINHNAIPPSMGGLVRHYYFKKYLEKAGHTVELITSSKIHNTDVNMITDGSLYKKIEVDGIEYTFVRNRDFHGNGISRIVNILEFPQNLRQVCRKLERPDVIYVSSPDIITAYAGVKIAKKMKLPCVVEIRDLWPASIVAYHKISDNNPIIKILYCLEHWIYKNADQLVFTMSGGKDYITDKKWDRDIDVSKIYNINNGVDLEEFEYNKAHYVYKDKDLDNEAYYKVIYTGSIRKVNHLKTIVDTAEILQNMGATNILFLIWGDGTERQELQESAQSRRLKNIIFKGRVEKKYIPSILSKADINLLHGNVADKLFRYGCSANKLFDYMASGKYILSDLPMRDNPIEKYNLGKVVYEYSPQAIAKTIFEIYNNQKSSDVKVCKEFDYKLLSSKVYEVLKIAKENYDGGKRK